MTNFQEIRLSPTVCSFIHCFTTADMTVRKATHTFNTSAVPQIDRFVVAAAAAAERTHQANSRSAAVARRHCSDILSVEVVFVAVAPGILSFVAGVEVDIELELESTDFVAG